MRPRPYALLTLTLTLTLGLASTSFARQKEESNKAPEGFVALFDGKTLDGWRGFKQDLDPRKIDAMTREEKASQFASWTEDAKKHWSVQDGDLVNDGGGCYLATAKDYGDIDFLIDYKTVAKADSGIYLKATPQVQIWDFTEAGGKHKLGADKGSGGLWNNSPGAPGKDPLVFADHPFGEWNRLRIIQIGARTTVYLNGKLVVDHATMENYFDKERKTPLYARGPIELQTHGGEIRWKNIYLREIPPGEANKLLAARDPKGFQTIFGGKSTEGWKGPIGDYEIVDGAIRCQPGKGGTIYYDKELTDFVARLEFKLPPGGNNGLAIRYPGQGDPAYSGMCELQVLDDGAAVYSKLDPRQAHGSAYGMVAAKRGYLRPVGEWNFEEVTVKGSTIKVELNGTLILDADLGKVDQYLASHAHPGKNLTSGYFGFAGHNDPVEFRNVAIKPLP